MKSRINTCLVILCLSLSGISSFAQPGIRQSQSSPAPFQAAIPVNLVANGQGALISTTPDPLIRPNPLSSGGLYSASDYQFLFPVRANGKWGLINQSGELVADTSFTAILPANIAYKIVVMEGRKGLINPEGRMILPPVCQDITSDSHTNFRFLQDSLWGFYNPKTDSIIPAQYKEIGIFRNGIARTMRLDSSENSNFPKEVWGVINESGMEVIPTEFEEITVSANGDIYFRNENDSGMYSSTLQKKIDSKYQSMVTISKGDILIKVQDKWGLIQNGGKVLISPRFTQLQQGPENNLYFWEGNKKGICDRNGKVIYPAKYEDFAPMGDNWTGVMLGGKWAVVNPAGKQICKPIYSSVFREESGLFKVYAGDYLGIMNPEGQLIVPTKYRQIHPVEEGGFRAFDGSRWEYYNTFGVNPSGKEFDYLGSFQQNLAIVKVGSRGKGLKWGIINIEGTLVVEPKYEQIKLYGSMAKLLQNGTWITQNFDKFGEKTNRKKFIIISEKPDRDLGPNRGSRPGNSDIGLGWFVSRSGRYGFRHPETDSLHIRPVYNDARFLPNQNLVLLSKRTGSVYLYSLALHKEGRQITPSVYQHIEFNEFNVPGSLAHAIHQNGRPLLMSPTGKVRRIKGATYIGPFIGETARVCIKGKPKWVSEKPRDFIKTRHAGSNAPDYKEYLIYEGGKWGFIDRRGRWVQEAIYDEVTNFSNGIAYFRDSLHWGAIDTQFNELIAPELDVLHEFMGGRNGLVMGGMEGRSFGFVDENGSIVIDAQFQDAGAFREGLCRVKSEGKWGFIDPSGEMVIPANYSGAFDFWEGMAKVKMGRLWYFIDRNGKPLKGIKFNRAGDFQEGRAWVIKNSRYGFIDQTGKWVIQPKYLEVEDFYNGQAQVRTKKGWGLIQKDGDVLLNAKYVSIGQSSEGFTSVRRGKQYGYVDSNGKWLVRPRFEKADAFSEGMAAVKYRGSYAWIDNSGKIAIKGDFVSGQAFSGGLAAAKFKNHWGFINKQGEWVIEPVFNRAGSFSEGRAVVRKGRNWVYIDEEGNAISEKGYAKGEGFQNGLAKVMNFEGKWGYIDPTGAEVIPLIHTEAKGYQGKTALVQNEKGDWLQVDALNQQVCFRSFKEVGEVSESLVAVKFGMKMGLFDKKGKPVLPVEYESFEYSGPLIRVENGQGLGWATHSGDWVWEIRK